MVTDIGTERALPGGLAPREVNSLSRITLENNGKVRPEPDWEKLFNGLSGGRGGIRTHGALPHGGFQDRCNRPLCHPSASAVRLGDRREGTRGRGQRQGAGALAALSAPASATTPSLREVPPQSSRPASTPDPRSLTPRAVLPQRDTSGDAGAPVGPSGDEGAGLTAEAAPGARCIA